jgi:hypothetical protein
MTEESNKELNEKANENIKPKYKVPVLSFEEFVKNEMAPPDRKHRGPARLKKEDAEKFDAYFRKR